MTNDIEQLAARARAAATVVATLPTATKNDCLEQLATRIEQSSAAILRANDQDMQAATAAGLGDAKLRRLRLSDAGIKQMADGLRHGARLDDPVGAITKDYTAPSGLHVRKVRCPLGVILMIYEARPNVTVDAFALCFKAGNACLLKGGREASQSNRALADLIAATLRANGAPADAITLITTSDRDEMRRLLALDQYIDLAIPRGGEELIRFVREHARIPTVQHYHGVCHVFVDASADLDKALDVCVTAKTSAPATCNAAECVLVHEAIAPRFVPPLIERLRAEGVEVRGDAAVCALALDIDRSRRQGLAADARPAGDDAPLRAITADVKPAGDHAPLRDITANVKPALDDDWGREFLDLILAVKVVPDLDAAIAHIRRYGSNHTDAILSTDEANQRRFVSEVQSSCTLVNASTRFNDGFQLGLGAEIGISTSKIHAYGPMGLDELTTQRYVVSGAWQCR